MSRSRFMKLNRLAGMAVLAVSILAPQYSALAVKKTAAKRAESAKAVLDKVSRNMAADDEVAEVKMVILEPNGDKREKRMEIRRKGEGKGQKVLVRIQGPASEKGIALLSKPDGDGTGQWLYLPSNKQVRRLVGASGKGGSFLGSELRNEDLGGDGKFESRLAGGKVAGGKKYTLIENTPQGESSYGKTILWVDSGSYLVARMEYFDKAMRPLKVTEFRDYKKEGGAWRARVIEVRNSQNKRGTRLELSGLKLNRGLPDSDFTESVLTEGD